MDEDNCAKFNILGSIVDNIILSLSIDYEPQIECLRSSLKFRFGGHFARNHFNKLTLLSNVLLSNLSPLCNLLLQQKRAQKSLKCQGETFITSGSCFSLNQDD